MESNKTNYERQYKEYSREASGNSVGKGGLGHRSIKRQTHVLGGEVWYD